MITVVIGGCYGSEGKGSVTQYLATNRSYDLVIRTGGPNAGHTIKPEWSDVPIAMKQLPCTWPFQSAALYLPSSSVIDPHVLAEELDMILSNNPRQAVYIHPNAAIITQHEMNFQEYGRDTARTMKGVGSTRSAKCLREAVTAYEYYVIDEAAPLPRGVHVDDYPTRGMITNPESEILIESTQGFGLSLHLGPYPFCTSENITTYQVLDAADIPFGVHEVEPWLVVRTYPIRIAGNSGPLKDEISWEELQRRHGPHIPVEQTTVTKKTRRVGEWDPDLVKAAIARNKPTEVVLTFADYAHPVIATAHAWGSSDIANDVWDDVERWLDTIDRSIGGHRVTYLGVGIGKLLEL